MTHVASFLVGILAFSIFMWVIGAAGPGYLPDTQDLITKCEESLSRSERCVLIAVPEGKND